MSTPERYLKPEVYQALAPQYVSGLLRGKARARFVYLMQQHNEIKAAVTEWEQQLDGLNERLMDVDPSTQLLNNIQQRIDFSQPQEDASTRSGGKLQHWLSQWWLGTGGVLASLLLLTVLVWQNIQEPVLINYVAVLENSTGDAQWVATSSKVSRKLKLDRLGDPLKASDNTNFVVWAISKEDGSFYRFGEVTNQEQRWIALDDKAWTQIKSAQSLIITAETSAIGQLPKGPVVAKGLCVQINYETKKPV